MGPQGYCLLSTARAENQRGHKMYQKKKTTINSSQGILFVINNSIVADDQFFIHRPNHLYCGFYDPLHTRLTI